MKTEKTVEELRQESNRMRTLGMSSAAAAIVGGALFGLVSVPLAAVVGLGGIGIAAASLVKKLSDDRAVAKRIRTSEAELVPTR